MNLKIRARQVCKHTKQAGFTLLEILIALFIFTIISMMLVSALHSVINTLTGVEASAERLRKLQMVLLLVSRDIEQTTNRPVLDANGNEEAAFIGTPRSFTFTHLGYASLAGTTATGGMQRTNFFWDRNTLWRKTYPAVDQAPEVKPNLRALLDNVTNVRFQYLDNEGHFQDSWPQTEAMQVQSSQPLPRAVRVVISIAKWGTVNQLYVIAAQPGKNLLPGGPVPTSTTETRPSHTHDQDAEPEPEPEQDPEPEP